MTGLCCPQSTKAGGKPRKDGLWPRLRIDTSRMVGFVVAAGIAMVLISLPCPLAAQSAESDAEDARIDALLATPGAATPVPQSNLIATAPGLEQQAPTAQFGFNFLAPFTYNSNAEEIRTGGTSSLELSPVGSLSFAAPLLGLPVRLSANAVVENDRFVSSRGANLDKIGGSLRFQYVDPDNDQGFSPYVAYASRFDFLPTFSEEVATRQDVNLGFNKRFNLDGNFQSVPFAGSTAALTVWSFGLTIFGQRRFRDPTPSSSALFFVPSVSYVISEQWNVSIAVEVISRWFDSNAGFSRRDWEAQPIATLEYIIPTSLFGAPETADFFGRPALDFQTSFDRNWSNLSLRNYHQWTASAVIKTGWRF
ncbi:hypothetical protein QEV83_16940 [Methylocapsa sp. D3K7]|uniref:hypothetical protein n=1 Tax=Methylocapsa sp. D3K7 TaxID=3041435 RepID=UPI00244EA8CA|nr:hypothetical protein [Methylocapsa sp. D3K7]WGJ14310.1 hypothetical protein QEV83_16940 [Methylocapsa sp. D3K7]